MNKLLTAGLVAAVAMTSANASQCGNGGFYVLGNFGISSNQMKYKNNLDDQKGVMDYRTLLQDLPKMMKFNVQNGGNENIAGYTELFNYKDLDNNKLKLDITKKSLKKRKGIFLFELGFGYDFRINDVMMGIDINFGKYFGNVKKKTNMLALTNYLKAEDLNHPKVNTITDAHHVVNVVNDRTRGSGYIEDQKSDIDAHLDDRSYVKTATIVDAKAKMYDPNSEYVLKLKNKYLICLMPRLGCLISSELEVYITANDTMIQQAEAGNLQ